MREEKADLRAHVYMMEKEKKSLELTVSSQQAQEFAMKTHIEHLQDELENQDSLVVIDFNYIMLNCSCTHKIEYVFSCIGCKFVLTF